MSQGRVASMIEKWWKAIVALFSAFMAGASAVAIFGGFVSLPKDVMALEALHADDVAAIEERFTDIETVIDRLDILVCILINDQLDRPVEDCVGR
jgi:hypothetical protein